MIAIRLKNARERAGYFSVTDFCKNHNLILENYLNHEEGKTVIKASDALKYSKILNVSLKTLLIGEIDV